MRRVLDDGRKLPAGDGGLRLLREHDLQPGPHLSLQSVRQPVDRERRQRRGGRRDRERGHERRRRRGGERGYLGRRRDLGRGGDSGGAGTSGTAGTTGAGGSAPVNLIKNGDFTLGKEYWNLTYQAGEVAADNQGMGGQYCMIERVELFYLSFSLGYPPTPSDAFTIAGGSTYTLTYAVAVDQPASLMVKIGGVETPYTELVSFADSVSSSNFTTFSHQVTSPSNSPLEGLVFNTTLYYGAQICFDNVSAREELIRTAPPGRSGARCEI